MPRKAEDPMEMIRKDIESKFDMTCAKMAAEMTWRIQSGYESVVQSFYDDYTPRFYNRTYSTYLASDRESDPFGFTPTSDGYNAGIIVDHENIPGSPYRADKHWVFTRTFKEGIHGFFQWEYKKWANRYYSAMNRKYMMSNARKERLKKLLLKTLKHSPRKYRKGVKTSFVYTSGDINSTHLSTGTAIQTRGFSYTPMKAMDAYFKKVTAKKEMDTLFQTIFEQYLNQ